MRKLLTLVLFFCCTTFLYATEKDDTPKNSLTNHFQRRAINNLSLDWFIGGGVGGQLYFGDHDRQIGIFKRITPAYEIYVGKWVSENVGIRVGYSGSKIKGLTQDSQELRPTHSTGVLYRNSDYLYHQEFSYMNLYTDAIFNASNMMYGVDKSRIYNLKPYIGLGFAKVKEEPKSQSLSGHVGIQNSFTVAKNFEVTADVRGDLVSDKFDGEVGGRKGEGILTVKVGINYTFGK